MPAVVSRFVVGAWGRSGVWWVRCVIAALAGGVLYLAFPSHDLWWAAPLGVALFVVATGGVGLRGGAVLGFVCGVCFFAPLLQWTAVFLGWSLPIFALLTLESLYMALAGVALAAVQRPVPGWRLPVTVAVAVVWTGTEWLRSVTPFGGFAWGRLAFSQADSPMLSAVPYVGATGLTFLVALVGALLACGARGLLRAWRSPQGRKSLWSACAAAVAALLVVGGAAVLPRQLGDDAGSVQVLGVQGNVPRAGLDFNAERRAVTDNHADATKEAARKIMLGKMPRPDLVVWPENSSDIDPIRNSDAGAVIKSAVQAVGAPLFVGAVLAEPAPQVTNAMLLFLPGRGIVDRYDKRHPVPFAEYIPFRSVLRQVTPLVDQLLPWDFVKGARDVVFSLRDGQVRVATPICFEVAIDTAVSSGVRAGANLLAVPTNNATFGFTDESVQQLAISRIRAVEFGRSVVHVSTVGVSALITPDGAAHQRTDLYTQAVVAGQLPLRENLTPAAYLSVWPGVVTSVITVLLLFVQAVRVRRGGPARLAG
ncbi:apolipoprotein N-acyltransferase [Dermatophilus congolensis]|nr:apolipoprotein N-acyltransferase [Dermatophilus congolensis]MBO3131958.1 apolipoprotein N-acyltransferase [Dermatophilus congolensis]MBO3133886.1 apolipoprotein N-acyltransferase [Dermatophilus congolensis]MBO3136116.1 apolipoprotein N-acyltransferase [Dermatophilus congolensis]MBO3138360.1 apolipoprotein N-acyltransferase [Dermatophilus congolensis]